MAPQDLYLGIDLSTQSLKVVAVDEDLKVVDQELVNFDKDLPEFKTKSGVWLGDGGVVQQPVLLFIKALDLVFGNLKKREFPFERIRAVSGAAQQHATVFTSSSLLPTLESLNSSLPLADQIGGCFTQPVCHNWQDSSTTAECRALEELVGGEGELALRTGSRAHERFSASQILKFRKSNPEAYAATANILLISALLSTLLLAASSASDESDVCGMNLWNLQSSSWDSEILDFVAGGQEAGRQLEMKLGRVQRDSGRSLGQMGKYWEERFGFQGCEVCSFTGDNNATVLFWCLEAKEAIVSLGTSDTLLIATKEYHPKPEFHIFAHPASVPSGPSSSASEYMGMVCVKNGSLAREYVRDIVNKEAGVSGEDWGTFDTAVAEGKGALSDPPILSFTYLKPEIVPQGYHGSHFFKAGSPVDSISPSTYASTILESQFLSLKVRSAGLLGSSPVSSSEAAGASSSEPPLFNTVYAVGGAARNTALVKRLADVMGTGVNVPVGSDGQSACAIGGAMKARWCHIRLTTGNDALSFEASVKTPGKDAPARSKIACKPDLDRTAGYDFAAKSFIKYENMVGELCKGR